MRMRSFSFRQEDPYWVADYNDDVYESDEFDRDANLAVFRPMAKNLPEKRVTIA
jgi:hypothetical protein